MEPTVSGTADLQYLNEALARAGARPVAATELVTQPLTDGRTGAPITRLQPLGEERSFVLKVVPVPRWRAMLGLDGTEARLWLTGATRTLPAGLRCPTIDTARHDATGQWWILMEDVSTGILPRGTYDETKANALLRSIARMHARYWGRDQELAPAALPSFEVSTNALATLTAHVARGGPAAEPWLAELANDFWVSRQLLPVLLNELGSADADFYVDLCTNHPLIIEALARHERTLIHGDLRRANIAYVADDVVLFDWEFGAYAPPARDLAWYWYLQFWAYPPPFDVTPDRRRGLAVYLDTLDRERGVPLDRATLDESCDLAWLSVLCQIGCVLADGLTGTPDSIERAKRTIADAIASARRIQDRHVR